MNHVENPRVAVVTGASAGIGKATARMLAECGWQVIGVGRDPGRTAAAEDEIRSRAPGARLNFVRGDFDEMKDVLRVSQEVASLTDRIDVLINNAGGIRDQRYATSDGFEAMFAANHLAAFLLTRELLPLLRSAAISAAPGSVRVIGMASSGHAMCPAMNWDDLNFRQNFSTGAAYCQAKLANILFTRELARRVTKDGIVAQCMHPGRVASNFASHGDDHMRRYMESAATITPDEPAKTLVWLASEGEGGNKPGRYFHDLQEVAPAPQALDDVAAKRLWDESEMLLREIGL